MRLTTANDFELAERLQIRTAAMTVATANDNFETQNLTEVA
jgi:hypothetical protein